MSGIASVNLIVTFGILAGVLLCIPTGVKAQQDNSDFLIKPQSNNVSICNYTGNEEATLIFHCAVKDADRIVWMINEAPVDKNKYPYGVSSYKDVTYSSFTYDISGDSDEIIVQCQLRRDSMTSISEAATISVISCSCPETGTEQNESEDTRAGTQISNDTSAAGGLSCQPTNDSIVYKVVMAVSLFLNVVALVLLVASICYCKWRTGGTSRMGWICSDGGNVTTTTTTNQDDDTDTEGVARPRICPDNSDVITTQEMADHHDACQELKGLSQEELINLGDELGLSYLRLKEMTEPLCEEMVAAWLSKADNVLKRTGQPTWRSLADALKRIGQADIANKIIRERVEMESRQGLAVLRVILYLLAVAVVMLLWQYFSATIVPSYLLGSKVDLIVSESQAIINRSETSNTTVLPYIPEMDFIHIETQTINQSEVIQTIDLQKFGLILHFQPNTSLESFNITIGVRLSANYTPPEGTTLVSAIYFIHTSSQLLRPATVEIEHSVDIDWDQPDSNQTLIFGKASTHSSAAPPYVFKTLSGGNFSRNFWGTIELSNFSAVGIFSEGENASIDYIAYLLSLHHKGRHGIYHVALLTSHNLNTIEEVLKKDFGDWVRIMNPFSFIFLNENKELILNVTREGITTGNWNIKPKLLPPKISKRAIDYHGLERYELKVSWMSKDEEKLLEYFMDVDGISRESFLIFIDPYEIPGTISNNAAGSDTVKNRKHLECTEIRDLIQLNSAVADIGDWVWLCMLLKVDKGIMNTLRYSESDNRVKKRECLEAYWNTGEAYWEDVVRAINSRQIMNKRVARDIVERYKLNSDILESTDDFFCNDRQCN